MDFLEAVIVMIVGAVIGGTTNYIAIKMLFRPYRPLYIGKWKLPFTPGLIPKRREEMAEQLGKTVVRYLLTPDSIKRRLTGNSFQKKVIQLLQNRFEEWLRKKRTPAQLLNEWFVIEDVEKKLESNVQQKIEKELRNIWETYENRPIFEWLPKKTEERIAGFLPEIAGQAVERIASYLAGEDGKNSVATAIDDFFTNRGTVFHVLQMFFDREQLTAKVQTELLRWVRRPAFRKMVENLLLTEWARLKNKTASDFLKHWQAEEISRIAGKQIVCQLPLRQLLHTPAGELIGEEGRKKVIESIPRLIKRMGGEMSVHLDEWLALLKIDNLVRDEVNTFAISRLEELVLSISKKEFKMITWLGALLGAVIALFQVLIFSIF